MIDNMPHFLPITLEEVKRLGWEQVDVVLVTGDAYIDHPALALPSLDALLRLQAIMWL